MALAGPTTLPSPTSVTPGIQDKHDGNNLFLNQDVRLSFSIAGISPSQFTCLFAQEAANTLSNTELEQLIDCLKKPFVDKTPSLRPLVNQRLNEFYAAEVEESGEPRHRLAAPFGPEGARLGIIMHCLSKEGEIGEFWDPQSRSIQALAAKGLDPGFAYGLDWYWRAESSGRRAGKVDCPIDRWSDALRFLNDELPADLLKILPLPFVVIAGNCARVQYLQTLSLATRRLILSLPSNSIVELDLDFTPDRLNRITTHILTPLEAFFKILTFRNTLLF